MFPAFSRSSTWFLSQVNNYLPLTLPPLSFYVLADTSSYPYQLLRHRHVCLVGQIFQTSNLGPDDRTSSAWVLFLSFERFEGSQPTRRWPLVLNSCFSIGNSYFFDINLSNPPSFGWKVACNPGTTQSRLQHPLACFLKTVQKIPLLSQIDLFFHSCP